MSKDYTGFGSLNEALQKLGEQGYSRVLVIASRSGWERFNAHGTHPFFTERAVEVFSDFTPNPDFRDILKCSARIKDFKPDLLVAFGGGSPIDVAKAAKAEAFTREPYDPNKPDTLKPSGDGPALIAIPTTAGSGSEATQYAVFYLGEAKQSLSHPSLRPDVAVVDPEMSYSMPPGQTAATGFDALSQAVEAFWASSTTEEAQKLSEVAIGYVIPNIYNAVTAPSPGNRYHMAQAAYLAGQAINVTRTTIPHALGYHLTKKYGLPHGHAVALTLPYFFVLNLDSRAKVITPAGPEGNRRNMEKLVELLRQKTPEDCFEFWRNLMKACGLAPTLRDVGLTSREQIRELVSTMNPERMKNHPVQFDADFLVDCFASQ